MPSSLLGNAVDLGGIMTAARMPASSCRWSGPFVERKVPSDTFHVELRASRALAAVFAWRTRPLPSTTIAALRNLSMLEERPVQLQLPKAGFHHLGLLELVAELVNRAVHSAGHLPEIVVAIVGRRPRQVAERISLRRREHRRDPAAIDDRQPRLPRGGDRHRHQHAGGKGESDEDGRGHGSIRLAR